jgi:hypothetical protein
VVVHMMGLVAVHMMGLGVDRMRVPVWDYIHSWKNKIISRFKIFGLVNCLKVHSVIDIIVPSVVTLLMGPLTNKILVNEKEDFSPNETSFDSCYNLYNRKS